MGLPNRVPPVVFRKVPYNWLDKQCGGVPIRKPGKKKKKKNMRGRKLLADPTLDPDSLATTTGRVVASPNDEAGFAHSRSLAGYMRRPVDVQPDGTVLGAMQVMWKNIKASKSIDGKFKPGRSKWIEVRTCLGSRVHALFALATCIGAWERRGWCGGNV